MARKAKAAKKPEQRTIQVPIMKRGRMRVFVVGDSPLVLNRLSEKAKRDLLMPRGGRLSRADRQTHLKHDPLAEFRAAPYTLRHPDAPTLLAIKGAAFKRALGSASLITEGATSSKKQIEQLTFVEDEYVGVYGTPEVYMTGVIQAGFRPIPDIRTRAILPRWACALWVNFIERGSALSDVVVTTLLANAGMAVGVGDGRPEKGALAFGRFHLTGPNDPEYVAIVKAGGRAAQVAALEDPTAYDDETQELLTWFAEQVKARGVKTAEDRDDEAEEIDPEEEEETNP